MGIVTEMLTTLGANLPLVAVGCAEVLAAAALLGRARRWEKPGHRLRRSG